jgi:hypothetical protein
MRESEGEIHRRWISTSNGPCEWWEYNRRLSLVGLFGEGTIRV